MSEPIRFLTTFAQTLSTMALYRDGHPARARAVDASYAQLRELQQHDARPSFSFLGDEVIYGKLALRELKAWDWSVKLGNAGIQRLEFEDVVSRDEYEAFLEEVLIRLNLVPAPPDTAAQRQTRRLPVRFGAVGIKGEGRVAAEAIPTATIAYSLGEEIDAVQWMHDEVASRGQLPLIEAEAVVRSLSVAMHGDNQIVIPLLQLKEFDQYTTSHSMNVAVLTMGLAEFLGMAPRQVRAFGVAGLLHDLGKVHVPREVLNKPGKLTDDERRLIQKHPEDGARIIIASHEQLDLAAAVAYEHHIMLNGQGYPTLHITRDCHYASKLVHVCDVYDALRTKRPYRDAWESERALVYLEERSGTEFDPEIATAFIGMLRQWDRRTATFEDQRTPVPSDGAGAG